jgi:hypothetical protein
MTTTRKKLNKQDKVRKNASRRATLAKMRADLIDKPLHPDHFYRLNIGPIFFGYSHARLLIAIRDGDVPTPIALSDTGRAQGWFGRTIIAWQQERQQKATEKKIVQPQTNAEAHR